MGSTRGSVDIAHLSDEAKDIIMELVFKNNDMLSENHKLAAENRKLREQNATLRCERAA